MRKMLRIVRWLMVVVLLVGACPGAVGETVDGLPAPTGYVDDFAGVLTAQTRAKLEELCAEADREAHAQIAVVTVKSIDADKDGTTPTIEEFATALEDKWKVGSKGTDRGVLMIFVMNPAPVHGRIEVGYGLEGLLNDAKVGDIGREMKPVLASGDLNRGISLGVNAIAQDIAADAGVTLATEAGDAPAHEYHYQTEPQMQVSPVTLIVVGGIVVVVVGILIATGHIGMLFFLLFGGGGRVGPGGDGEGGAGFGGFGGGGGGDGEGGGGFGGFDGGSSGGGGADF